MSSPPANLGIREASSIANWRDERPETVCGCGAWMRNDITGTLRCARGEAIVNRYGQPAGERVCDGRVHPDDRFVLTATVCGVSDIVVGIVRSWDAPLIAVCELCEWRPNEIEGKELRKLKTHLEERHGIPPDLIETRLSGGVKRAGDWPGQASAYPRQRASVGASSPGIPQPTLIG